MWRSALALAGLAAALGCEVAVPLDHLDDGCPPAPGPAQVRIATANYCIDSTEVTNAQYAQFQSQVALATANALPPECGAPSSPPVGPYFALAAAPPPGSENLPVVQVNWCQAYGYCAWAGKRLCGQIGGGPLLQLNPVPMTQAPQSQWLWACSAGGKRKYPYGATFDPLVCGGQVAGAILEPVATQPGCVGGYSGLFDMSGNVWEWVDSCGSNDPTALCTSFGGAFDATPTELACIGFRWWGRMTGAANMGIRCCRDL
jgi:formylglycine-generating enzyme required for sulfatase activity